MKLQLLIIFLLSLTLVNAALIEDTTEYVNNYSGVEVGKLSFTLPIRIGIKTLDTNENFILILNKQGKLELKDSGKADIVFFGTADDFRTLLSVQEDDDLAKVITKFQIQARTFKGNILINILERELDVKFNVNKSFSYRLANIVTGLFFV